jgi:2-polyprenyl-3-methyl-5-hydroxy-6-metoxy-1,4-benzoquinol methylase
MSEPSHFEQISLQNDSLFACHAENILRYGLALPHCADKRVFDAGCGSGYGAHFLAKHGAHEVTGADANANAIEEAVSSYVRENLTFSVVDLEKLAPVAPDERFDTIVHFETLPHLNAPEHFVRWAAAALAPGGSFIVSAPNGDLVQKDEHGKPLYTFQHHAFNAESLRALLARHFVHIEMHGQWLTHEGKLRQLRARQHYDALCELYYNPLAKIGRVLKRLKGRPASELPPFRGAVDSYAGDHQIEPLAAKPFPWDPATLIAVCNQGARC